MAERTGFEAAPDSDGQLVLARNCSIARAPAGFLESDVPKSDGDAGALILDATESHLIAIAPIGAGKARHVLMPIVLRSQASMVIVDVKGEAAHVTGRYRQRMGHRVLIIDPTNRFQTNHPELEACRGTMNLMEYALHGSTGNDLADRCTTLMVDIAGPEQQKSSLDPFWRNNGIHLGTGLLGWLWVRAKVTGEKRPDDQTMAGVINMANGEELAYQLATILDTCERHPEFPPHVGAAFRSFLQHERERVQSSVRSELISMMQIFTSDSVQTATSTSTLPPDFMNDHRRPFSVYLVFPPDKLVSHGALLRLYLTSLLGAVTHRRTKPRIPTLFLIDELGHLGPIAQIKQSITLMRGYGMRVALFLQSISQLKGLWPQDYESILENCGIWMNFGNNTLSAAKAVSDQLGDVSADTLFGMSKQQLALHRAGRGTVIADRIDYLTDPLFTGKFDPNPYYGNVEPPAPLFPRRHR